MECAKESNYESCSLLDHKIIVVLSTALAIINGKVTSIYELTLEYLETIEEILPSNTVESKEFNVAGDRFQNTEGCISNEKLREGL
ncbi:6313_t:CDS:2 [Entrophospora sp. SA101]|nr:6313_t:CDS:2 [Entrophospora sp. SA101]